MATAAVGRPRGGEVRDGGSAVRDGQITRPVDVPARRHHEQARLAQLLERLLSAGDQLVTTTRG